MAKTIKIKNVEMKKGFLTFFILIELVPCTKIILRALKGRFCATREVYLRI